MSEWFKDWFNTKYYHILYKNRDEEEARSFISNLVDELKLSNDSKVLDLACGKGRHAKMLNELGLSVVGLDLSPQSILEAQKLSNSRLRFDVHDMREPYSEKGFDAVFNLFTSFGYFEDFDDNRKVLRSIATYLTDSGILVIDYLNSETVIKNLVADEQKVIDGIKFNINRSFDGTFIRKRIEVKDKDQYSKYEEKVQAINHTELTSLVTEEGFNVESVYGDYELSNFDPQTSERLIVIARVNR